MILTAIRRVVRIVIVILIVIVFVSSSGSFNCMRRASEMIDLAQGHQTSVGNASCCITGRVPA